MIYIAILFILLSIALYLLYLKTLKGRDFWKDKYWMAQAEIDRLYELKFKECTQQKKN